MVSKGFGGDCWGRFLDDFMVVRVGWILSEAKFVSAGMRKRNFFDIIDDGSAIAAITSTTAGDVAGVAQWIWISTRVCETARTISKK